MLKLRTSGADVVMLALWCVFFAAGLVPERAFNTLRNAAAVTPFTAWVNSSVLLVFALIAYFTAFAYRRARDTGSGPVESAGRAFQLGLLSSVAFLEIPSGGSNTEHQTLIELLLYLGRIEDSYLRNVVLAVSMAKVGAWLYLLSLLVRLHLFGRPGGFGAALPPSSRRTFVSPPPRPEPAQLEIRTPDADQESSNASTDPRRN
ncbi:MAG: hypothetical protein AAB353_01345 [Candidatus Hydrogenedentota bacterium]